MGTITMIWIQYENNGFLKLVNSISCNKYSVVDPRFRKGEWIARLISPSRDESWDSTVPLPKYDKKIIILVTEI